MFVSDHRSNRLHLKCSVLHPRRSSLSSSVASNFPNHVMKYHAIHPQYLNSSMVPPVFIQNGGHVSFCCIPEQPRSSSVISL